MQTQCLISVAMDIFSLSTAEASEAVCPMMMSLPILVSMPVAMPSKQVVEEKLVFFVSKGLS